MFLFSGTWTHVSSFFGSKDRVNHVNFQIISRLFAISQRYPLWNYIFFWWVFEMSAFFYTLALPKLLCTRKWKENNFSFAFLWHFLYSICFSWIVLFNCFIDEFTKLTHFIVICSLSNFVDECDFGCQTSVFALPPSLG